MTATVTERQSDRTASDSDIDHLYCCCDRTVGICGTRLKDDEEDCPDECDHDQCVVCADLQDIICPKCGFGSTGPCACGEFC